MTKKTARPMSSIKLSAILTVESAQFGSDKMDKRTSSRASDFPFQKSNFPFKKEKKIPFRFPFHYCQN